MLHKEEMNHLCSDFNERFAYEKMLYERVMKERRELIKVSFFTSNYHTERSLKSIFVPTSLFSFDQQLMTNEKKSSSADSDELEPSHLPRERSTSEIS